MNLQKLVDLYLVKREIDIPNISVRTFNKEQWMLKKHILPTLGGSTSVADIEPLMVSRFLRQLRKPNGDPYADSTVDGFTPMFKQLFEFAIGLGVIVTNPASHLKRKKMKQKDESLAPRDDVIAVARELQRYVNYRLHLPHAVRDAFVVSFSIDSGARRGEIHQLRLSLMERALQNPKQTRYGLLYRVPSTGKTGKAVLRFGERTAGFLVAYLAVRPVSTSDFLLLNPEGRPLHVASLHDAFKRVCAFVGVPVFQPHGVRHLNITDMLRNGADPKATAAYANHADEKITLAVYRHLVDDEVDEAAAWLINSKGDEVDEMAQFFGVR